MTELQISDGQSLLDVVIKQHGRLEALFDVAALNGFTLGQDLIPGNAIRIDETKVYTVAAPIRNKPVAVKSSTTIVSDGQSLLDIVLQETGSLEGLFEMAALNGLLISQKIGAGQVLQKSTEIKPELVQYFASRKHRINTGIYVVPTPPTVPGSGNGYVKSGYVKGEYLK